MRKYIPLVLFIFSWPVLSADVHGQIYAPDGMNVNQFMVRAGAAWVYEQYNTDPVLPVLQNEARQQKRGLWSDADPVPPWIWRHRK